MPDAIPRFLNRPTLDCPRLEHGQKMAFLIEAAHATAAWAVLMQKGAQFKVEPLWSGTPFQAQMAQGPSWFVVNAQCVDGLAKVCHQRPAGIALACADPVQALAHARTLLSMTPSGVLAIHDPVIWAALAMENVGQHACLFGPWHEVYTPVPAVDPTAHQWHVWEAETPATGPCQYPLTFPDTLYSTYTDIRWLHWLRQYPQHFAQVPDPELPRVISNLDFFVKHGIGADGHLLQLSALVTHGDLREREDLLPILTSHQRPHHRVEQLLQELQP
ncbi:hypothetical protein QN382_06245 [Pseudomonas sp. 10B1]|uniref:hypothetical protein n=1 Tax=unclassified Pseudomonas TaxID=196821 RepID=UPI002AB5BE65|nr:MULTISPECIES: hypothetical protein [unclassified Pseudomonas]MDY7563043.1 hypothetical protein [Pseudomonas sp. AB6]MEA9996844.1 hypothetical protein [Pseudomonas sp. AA4]MEB0085213.1 hypothetical protein [Pseudomonas sp. RTI1]MEB0125316.1 hypothetical protein [Pseudomonas sp. CCC1.2]MEB0153291.1 hypothetical protein [Pseudomonas sp. CCC4.3]